MLLRDALARLKQGEDTVAQYPCRAVPARGPGRWALAAAVCPTPALLPHRRCTTCSVTRSGRVLLPPGACWIMGGGRGKGPGSDLERATQGLARGMPLRDALARLKSGEDTVALYRRAPKDCALLSICGRPFEFLDFS